MNEDDALESTPGYKAKNVDVNTMLNMDSEDASLAKYKETLLGTQSPQAKDGPPVEIMEMAILVQDRSPIVLPLATPEDRMAVRDTPYTLKEGSSYRVRITFRVNAPLVSGLQYLNIVTRKGIRVDREQSMLGSFAAKEESYVHTFPWEETPSGMLARGHYVGKATFIDDDNVTHGAFQYTFDIKKQWSS